MLTIWTVGTGNKGIGTGSVVLQYPCFEYLVVKVIYIKLKYLNASS